MIHKTECKTFTPQLFALQLMEHKFNSLLPQEGPTCPRKSTTLAHPSRRLNNIPPLLYQTIKWLNHNIVYEKVPPFHNFFYTNRAKRLIFFLKNGLRDIFEEVFTHIGPDSIRSAIHLNYNHNTPIINKTLISRFYLIINCFLNTLRSA